MKTIGMIGGMSWESTASYYRIINEAVKERLGGFHSAKILLYSLDFQEIESCQGSGDWEKSVKILSDAALRLEKAGADFFIICTNTMHKVAPQVEKTVGIPLLHIADATVEELKSNCIQKAALLGTKFTMQMNFYKEKLKAAGIEMLLPDENDRELVNDVIYRELCLGVVSQHSKKEFQRMIALLGDRGAEGVILGCTEIGLLIRQEDSPLPVFDTAEIHALKAALHAIED